MEKAKKLIAQLNRRNVTRPVKDEFLSMGEEGYRVVLAVADDDRHSDLQRANALHMLLSWQLPYFSDPESFVSRNQNDLVRVVYRAMTSSRLRVRTAATVTAIRLAELVERGVLAGLPRIDRDVLEPLVKAALEKGLVGNDAAFARRFLEQGSAYV